MRLFFSPPGQINITTGRRLLDCSLTECLIKKEKLSGSLLLVRNILSKPGVTIVQADYKFSPAGLLRFIDFPYFISGQKK